MRRLVRTLLTLLGVLAALAAVSAWFAYQSTRRVPDFYAVAVSRSRNLPPQIADQFEKRLLDLRNDTRETGRWRTVLTDDQLNGWLARDLPAKFPRILPSEVRDPVVSIHKDAIRVGFRYHDARIDTVLWLEFEPFLTDDPRTLAAQVRKVRAGSLPIPTRQIVDQLTRLARQGNWPLRWDQSGGDPIALLRLPDKVRELNGRRITLQTIALRDGEIELTGHSDP